MEILFKSDAKVNKHHMAVVPKEVIETKIIMDFFKSIPIEHLKKLINFKKIDFENKELWNDYKKKDLLSQLRDENVVQYTCEIYLDDVNHNHTLDHLG